MTENQYAERDVIALDDEGGYYCRHVLAMTRESLDSKSDIGAELGWRDMQADKLREALDSMLHDLNASIRRESAEREKNAMLLARIAELEGEKSQATFQPVAARDVLKERLRQINQEGWTPEHDDTQESGEIARAAACYASHASFRWMYKEDPSIYRRVTEPNNWPWDSAWWKPVSPRRDLVRAGALILAEIDRIDRASYAESGDE